MKMRPILFNTKMVCAILDGRKSVMRRVIKPQPKNNDCEHEMITFNDWVTYVTVKRVQDITDVAGIPTQTGRR